MVNHHYSEEGVDVLQFNLLTVEEVAKLLRLSKAAVYSLITNKMLPIFRFGGAIRVDSHHLEEFIRSSYSEKIPTRRHHDT